MMGIPLKRGNSDEKCFLGDTREPSLISLAHSQSLLFEQFRDKALKEPPAIGIFCKKTNFILLIAFSGGLKALIFLNEL